MSQHKKLDCGFLTGLDRLFSMANLNWKWIPLEAVGFNLALNICLRIAAPLLYQSVLAAICVLSVLISWRLITRFEEVPSLRVAHGILLGVVANIFWVGWMVMTAPEGSTFAVTLESFLGSASIVLGCIVGGFVASYGRAPESSN